MALGIRQLSLTSMSLCCVLATPGWAAVPEPSVSSTPAFGYLVVGGVALATAFGLGTIRAALLTSTWSLADALSEEVELTLFDKDGHPVLGTDGKPQAVTQLRASTSRVIALIGLVAILMVYIGFALVELQRLAAKGESPTDDNLGPVIKFLLSGSAMFAPYLFNKLSSAFDWLTPKKS